MTRTIKLYLDDVRSPPDETWTLARTAEEAKALLADPAVDVECASLDHDMGECPECDAAWPPRGYRVVTNTCRHRMTGMDLVTWMVESGRWPRFKPAVHSANVEGKARMLAAIEEHWRPPPMAQRAEASRGTVETFTHRGDEAVRMWPRYDTEDRVEMTVATTGVLLEIASNTSDEDAAVFLTIEELRRLADEGERLYAAWLAQHAAERGGPDGA